MSPTPARTARVYEDLVEAACAHPFAVLGPCPRPGGGVIVRILRPEAWSVDVVRDASRSTARRVHPRGVFEAEFADESGPFPYRLAVRASDGTVSEIEDPYRFAPVLGVADLERFRAGRDFRLFERYGAHPLTHEGVAGVHFSVWAPHAGSVSVIGPFNDWDPARHPMRLREEAGVWELFLPALEPGVRYKYEIRTRRGERLSKADPFGFAMEQPPGTASIVAPAESFDWTDDAWLSSRPRSQALDRPISIYEVHLPSWRRPPSPPDPSGEERPAYPTYEELAAKLVPYAKDLGATHLELLPVTEHPFDGSWGYQTTGYFAPTARLGMPDGFRTFVDAAHGAGLGVLLDWVPGHFPKDGHGLVYFDGTHLYEHPDPRRGVQPQWGTYVFDFGRPQVVAFLVSSALYWLERYHTDGLRVDAVASMLYLDFARGNGEWVPNVHGGRDNLEAIAFLQTLNRVLHEEVPGALVCAEESTSWPGVTRPVRENGLGFDLKWNMGWMNDTLRYARLDPLARRHHQRNITFSLSYAFDENFILPLSHDEVVHGKLSLLAKMPGEDEALRFAGLRAILGYMWAHPGKKLLFMGAEIGQWREWHHDRELDWDLLGRERHRALSDWVRELNRLYHADPALHSEETGWSGFEWIDHSDHDRSLVSFVRRGGGRFLVVVLNFTPVAWRDHRFGVPAAPGYRVVLSSDEPRFSGTGGSIPEPVPVEDVACHERESSIVITVPPLSALFLEPLAEAVTAPPSGRKSKPAREGKSRGSGEEGKAAGGPESRGPDAPERRTTRKSRTPRKSRSPRKS